MQNGFVKVQIMQQIVKMHYGASEAKNETTFYQKEAKTLIRLNIMAKKGTLQIL